MEAVSEAHGSRMRATSTVAARLARGAPSTGSSTMNALVMSESSRHVAEKRRSMTMPPPSFCPIAIASGRARAPPLGPASDVVDALDAPRESTMTSLGSRKTRCVSGGAGDEVAGRQRPTTQRSAPQDPVPEQTRPPCFGAEHPASESEIAASDANALTNARELERAARSTAETHDSRAKSGAEPTSPSKERGPREQIRLICAVNPIVKGRAT
jgi:hypothetical protein